MKKIEIKKIAVSAMLTALAFGVTMATASFKVAGFLSLDFKDVFISIVALLYGPFYGIISVLSVALIEFVTISSTGLYGLVMNILSSGTFALVTGFVYKYKRNFSGAIISAVACVISVTSIMLLANIFITPLYFQMPREAVIDMLPTVLLPFNLCKALLNSALMLLLYKPITQALKKSKLIPAGNTSSYKFGIRSALLTVISIVIIVLAILFVVLKLGLQIG